MLIAALAFHALLTGGTAEQACALAQRALERGVLREQTADSGAAVDVLLTLTFCDRFELAEHACEEALEDARLRGSALRFARTSAVRAMLNYRRGAIADAEADARACIEAAHSSGYHLARMAHAPLVDALIERGALDEAERALDVAQLLDDIPHTLAFDYVLYSRGVLRLAQRRLKEAIADLQELARREQVWRAGNPSTLPYRSALAQALLRSRDADRERARGLAEEELELARRFGAPRAIGVALRTLASTHEGAEALELLQQSATVLQDSGAALEHARSLTDLGAALRHAGQALSGRECLRLALDQAIACRADALADRAQSELLAAGARPRRHRLTGAEALTPSEQRVAKLAAEGLTNREIAQSLFVTPRTVETHLTHVFQKLDITSRNQLTHALLQPPALRQT